MRPPISSSSRSLRPLQVVVEPVSAAAQLLPHGADFAPHVADAVDQQASATAVATIVAMMAFVSLLIASTLLLSRFPTYKAARGGWRRAIGPSSPGAGPSLRPGP